jgi:hypothetical protein
MIRSNAADDQSNAADDQPTDSLNPTRQFFF